MDFLQGLLGGFLACYLLTAALVAWEAFHSEPPARLSEWCALVLFSLLWPLAFFGIDRGEG